MTDIKLFAMDVDGTMTDGKLHIGDNGELFKTFDVQDGLGIMLLHEKGIIPVIITGRTSKIVEARAVELNITEVHQGVEDKAEVLKAIAEKHGIPLAQAAFIGDDINDLPAMEVAGISFAPANATDEIKRAATYVLKNKGGDGAIREAAEIVIGQQWATDDTAKKINHNLGEVFDGSSITE